MNQWALHAFLHAFLFSFTLFAVTFAQTLRICTKWFLFVRREKLPNVSWINDRAHFCTLIDSLSFQFSLQLLQRVSVIPVIPVILQNTISCLWYLLCKYFSYFSNKQATQENIQSFHFFPRSEQITFQTSEFPLRRVNALSDERMKFLADEWERTSEGYGRMNFSTKEQSQRRNGWISEPNNSRSGGKIRPLWSLPFRRCDCYWVVLAV